MHTQLLELDPAAYQPALLQPAVRVLADGGLVAFPTDTVYGVGARWDHVDAVRRLRELKERPEQPFSLLVASAEQLRAHVVEPSPLARRLIGRFWPGPLTLVLPALDLRARDMPARDQPAPSGAGGDGWIGVRMPAARQALDLVAQAGPLWAPSANPRGEPPALDAEQARAYFDGRVELVIDGRCPGGASTVVRVTPGVVAAGEETPDQLEVLREGPITRAALDRVAKTLVLFVCTGNTCRSPLAEALFRQALARRLGLDDGPADIEQALADAGYLAASAGTTAFGGAPASANSVEVAAERGVDLSPHRSRPVDFDAVADADLILTMTRGHLASLLELVPELADRAFVLDAGGGDIADPYGGPIDVYRRAADQIERGIESAIDRFGLA